MGVGGSASPRWASRWPGTVCPWTPPGCRGTVHALLWSGSTMDLNLRAGASPVHFCPQACTRPCRERMFAPGKSPHFVDPDAGSSSCVGLCFPPSKAGCPQMHHSFSQLFLGLSGNTGMCKPTWGLLPTPNTSFVKLPESSA